MQFEFSKLVLFGHRSWTTIKTFVKESFCRPIKRLSCCAAHSHSQASLKRGRRSDRAGKQKFACNLFKSVVMLRLPRICICWLALDLTCLDLRLDLALQSGAYREMVRRVGVLWPDFIWCSLLYLKNSIFNEMSRRSHCGAAKQNAAFRVATGCIAFVCFTSTYSISAKCIM